MANSTETVYKVLQDIAKQTRILSSTEFSHPNAVKEHIRSIGNASSKEVSELSRHEFLKKRLGRFLYGRYYNNSLALMKVMNARNDLVYAGADPLLMEKLQEANQGKGVFQGGWKVTCIDGTDQLFVKKSRITLWVNREIHLRPAERQASIGDIVSILFPKHQPYIAPGFYLAHGDVDLTWKTGILRFYFHLHPRGASELVRFLTSSLNKLQIGFDLKILSNPDLYSRYDNAVLYVDRVDYPVTRAVVSEVYSQLRTCFQSEVPLFTKCLAPGLSLAEEPPEIPESRRGFFGYPSESFGEHRCRLLAEGLLEAYLSNQNRVTDKVAAMINRFTRDGFDIGQPYLNPGSRDIYN